jgi:glycosyltransferase involved in cell wall biosynthesis
MSRYIPSSINLPIVLVEHEVLSRSFYERARFERMIVRRIILYLRSVKKSFEERAWYRRFVKIIVFTDYDRHIIKKAHKSANLEVVPLGIDAGSYLYSEIDKKEYDIVFAGHFSHYQNSFGAIHFLRKILPLIRKKLPDISVMIAGSAVPDEVRRLSKFDRNIHTSGYVDDMRRIYLRSRIAVVPIYFGSGMRYKILEAWVMRLPVVSTSIGARGFSASCFLRIADEKEDFAAQIINLLQEERLSRKLGLGARKIAEENYDWADIVKEYDCIYSGITQEYGEIFNKKPIKL